MSAGISAVFIWGAEAVSRILLIFLPGEEYFGQEWLTLWRTIKTIRDESEKNRYSLFGTDGGRFAAGQSPAGFRFRQRHGFAAAVRGASLGLGRTGGRGGGDRVVGRIDRPNPLRSGRKMDAEAENSRRGRTLYGYRFGRGGRYVGERADRRGVDLLGAVQYGDAGRRMGPRARLCPRDRKRRLASDTSVRRQAGFQFGSEGRCTGRRRRLAALLAADGSRLLRRRLLFRPRVA